MIHSDIVRTFGFQLPSGTPLESISPAAPVYRLSHAHGDWIIKRTQRPLARGRAVAAWTQALAAQGVPIVTPARGFGENPRAFPTSETGDDVWVVYPFIAGSAYTGATIQIGAAGKLLGAIHGTRAEADFGLKQSETVVAIAATEIEQDMAGILQHVHEVFPEFTAAAETTLAARTQTYFQRALPKLMQTRLPLANCSWDYKAANLRYPTSTTPVLVDADNAGRIPRAYDLAVAALLFHNEGLGPCRLFTPAEWAVFVEGYTQHIQFTAEEKRTWADLLACAWMDEALWLLRYDQPGWADPHQAQLLLSLLLTDLSSLALPD